MVCCGRNARAFCIVKLPAPDATVLGADQLAENGRGWLSEQGLVVQPSVMPAGRQDACVLQGLVGRMLEEPVLAASL